MDFTQLVSVEQANPRGRDYDTQLKKNTYQFQVAPAAYNRMQLAHNSLQQYNMPDGRVFLAVCPGATGVFCKPVGARKNGKQFKNQLLAQALQSKYPGVSKFSLSYAGNSEGKEFFEVLPNSEPGMWNDGYGDQEEDPATDPAEPMPEPSVADEQAQVEAEAYDRATGTADVVESNVNEDTF